MSNSGVNSAFVKCFILFMAVVILLQGSVYLLLAIWGLTYRECANGWSSQPFEFTMRLIYFLDKECGNPSIRLAGITESITLDVDFNKAEPIATRTLIIFISYAVISSLWIIASLAIITTLCASFTKTVNGLFFWTWFLIVVAGSILDAVATGFHIHDIMNTTSVAKTFKYLGISANNQTIEILSKYDAYIITPAAIMTSISSRVILIWLLNIFGSSFCVSVSKTLSKRNWKENSTACTTNIQQGPHPDTKLVQIQSYGEQSKGTQRSEPTLSSLAVQSSEEQHSSPSQPVERTTNDQLSKVPAPNLYSPSTPPLNENEQNNNDNIKKHLDRINNLLPRNAVQYQQQLSSISPLNNRYSINNESLQYPTQNQRVSEELRGQLPWSYTSFPSPVPKKAQVHVHPEIPPPDYS